MGGLKLKMVRRRIPVGSKGGVGKIGGGLREGAKPGGALCPSHGEDKWKGDKGLLMW